MATYDMTSKATAGVGADSIAVFRSADMGPAMRTVEAVLDIAKLTADGYVQANGDIFQLLEIPAGFLVLNAGAEVMTAFDGTTPTVDIDFAAGDDIVDGASVATTGFLAAGTNGQTNTVVGSAASTYTQFMAATDTIDVLLTAASADCTVGVLRVYANVIDCNEYGVRGVATDVDRDQLA